jgi:hypothetical protein
VPRDAEELEFEKSEKGLGETIVCYDVIRLFVAVLLPHTQSTSRAAMAIASQVMITGELYANDYAKAVLGATEVKEADSIKKELQTLWIDLSRRLDALSNFHYTPKPIVKVRILFSAVVVASLVPTML